MMAKTVGAGTISFGNVNA